jgi:hypothetical protein
MAQAQVTKVGRNDLCSCGSGKKFKKCCEAKSERSMGQTMMIVLISLILGAGLFAAISNFTTESTHVGKTSGVWDPVHGHYH